MSPLCVWMNQTVQAGFETSSLSILVIAASLVIMVKKEIHIQPIKVHTFEHAESPLPANHKSVHTTKFKITPITTTTLTLTGI